MHPMTLLPPNYHPYFHFPPKKPVQDQSETRIENINENGMKGGTYIIKMFQEWNTQQETFEYFRMQGF